MENTPTTQGEKPWGMETNTYLLLLHLSQFAGYLAAGLGFILPIVMWVSNKDKSPAVDEHGKEVTNFIISWLIYIIISFILILVVIGIPMLIVLGILGFIFPIIGAVKANNGEFYRYPLTIRFLK